MAFLWKQTLEFLRVRPGFNNAGSYGVRIEDGDNKNWIASVYHLSPDENKTPQQEFGGHFIYIVVLCKQGDLAPYQPVIWGWEGMTPEQRNLTGAIFCDKVGDEVKSHPIFAGQRIWMQVGGGDKVVNLNTMIDPDERSSDGSYGNTRGHHSYLVLFQEMPDIEPEPEPEPDPEPEPPLPPPPSLSGSLDLRVRYDDLEPDDDGYVIINVDFTSGW